jgi:hypothetical protein
MGLIPLARILHFNEDDFTLKEERLTPYPLYFKKIAIIRREGDKNEKTNIIPAGDRIGACHAWRLCVVAGARFPRRIRLAVRRTGGLRVGCSLRGAKV